MKAIRLAIIFGAGLLLCGCSPQGYDSLFPVRTSTQNADTLAVMAYLPDTFTLVSTKEAAEKKVMLWYLKALEEGRKQGFVPLIIIPSTILDQAASYNLSEHESTTAMLDEADVLYRQRSGEKATGEVPSLTSSLSQLEFYLYSDYTDEIILAQFPTKNPWELAAFIPMGGFNDCPSPAEQVAVFHDFYNRYGAIPAVVSYDSWQLLALHPPENDQDKQTLLKELIQFCPDTFEDMDVQDLYRQEKLPGVWTFWWD